MRVDRALRADVVPALVLGVGAVWAQAALAAEAGVGLVALILLAGVVAALLADAVLTGRSLGTVLIFLAWITGSRHQVVGDALADNAGRPDRARYACFVALAGAISRNTKLTGWAGSTG